MKSVYCFSLALHVLAVCLCLALNGIAVGFAQSGRSGTTGSGGGSMIDGRMVESYGQVDANYHQLRGFTQGYDWFRAMVPGFAESAMELIQAKTLYLVNRNFHLPSEVTGLYVGHDLPCFQTVSEFWCNPGKLSRIPANELRKFWNHEFLVAQLLSITASWRPSIEDLRRAVILISDPNITSDAVSDILAAHRFESWMSADDFRRVAHVDQNREKIERSSLDACAQNQQVVRQYNAELYGLTPIVRRMDSVILAYLNTTGVCARLTLRTKEGDCRVQALKKSRQWLKEAIETTGQPVPEINFQARIAHTQAEWGRYMSDFSNAACRALQTKYSVSSQR